MDPMAQGALSHLGAVAGHRLISHQRADGEADLIARAQKGDRRAFAALMGAHKHDLYRFVRRRETDADEAYDIVQEAFVAAWGAIVTVDSARPFRAWLRAIALNKCRDRARRANARRAIWNACAPGDELKVRDERPSPEEEAADRDQLAILRQALGALPGHLREALMLTAVDGLSQATASATLNCSVKALEYRVFRARELLAIEMKRRGAARD